MSRLQVPAFPGVSMRILVHVYAVVSIFMTLIYKLVQNEALVLCYFRIVAATVKATFGPLQQPVNPVFTFYIYYLQRGVGELYHSVLRHRVPLFSYRPSATVMLIYFRGNGWATQCDP
jgi:hypothetical protein